MKNGGLLFGSNYFLCHILLCKVLSSVEPLFAIVKRAEFPVGIFANTQHCPTCLFFSKITLTVKTSDEYSENFWWMFSQKRKVFYNLYWTYEVLQINCRKSFQVYKLKSIINFDIMNI